MSTLRTRLCLLVALVSAPGLAGADRYGRGLVAFTQLRCASCHTVGWREPVKSERKYVDVTRSAAVRDEGELVRWLQNPRQFDRESACTHRPLTAEQITDLLVFLKERAEPTPKSDGRTTASSAAGKDGVGHWVTAPTVAKVRLQTIPFTAASRSLPTAATSGGVVAPTPAAADAVEQRR